MKSVTTKLKELSETFNFTVDKETLEDHEKLAVLRYFFNIGTHSLAIKLVTEHYFNYIQYDREYLNGTFVKPILFPEDPIIIQATNQITPLDDRQATTLVERYHFLGYDREGFHLGLGIGNILVAVATLSPHEIKTINLSRLTRIPGQKCILSQFIAEIATWLKKNTDYSTMVTYCNSNAGHYRTIYRGANMIPAGKDETQLMSFLHGRYISKRIAHERNHPFTITKRTPLPQLMYSLRIR